MNIAEVALGAWLGLLAAGVLALLAVGEVRHRRMKRWQADVDRFTDEPEQEEAA